jgi:hypothetical protein
VDRSFSQWKMARYLGNVPREVPFIEAFRAICSICIDIALSLQALHKGFTFRFVDFYLRCYYQLSRLSTQPQVQIIQKLCFVG